MVVFFRILIVLGILFCGTCIFIAIKSMIDDFKNPPHNRGQKFGEWLRREDKSENFSDWLRRNYPYE